MCAELHQCPKCKEWLECYELGDFFCPCERKPLGNMDSFLASIKTCVVCEKPKSLKDYPFWKDKRKGKMYRSECRPCWAKKSYRQFKERQMAIFPEKWRQCDNDDCCEIYLRKKGNICPKCGEVNAEDN